MPLLQDIVQELDRELDRLHQIRAIVTGLSRTPAVIRRITERSSVNEAQAVTDANPKPKRRARSDGSQQRGPRMKKPEPEPRALAVAVPSGPVVFYPKRAPAPTLETDALEPVVIPERTPEQLEAESRALAARWAAQA